MAINGSLGKGGITSNQPSSDLDALATKKKWTTLLKTLQKPVTLKETNAKEIVKLQGRVEPFGGRKAVKVRKFLKKLHKKFGKGTKDDATSS